MKNSDLIMVLFLAISFKCVAQITKKIDCPMIGSAFTLSDCSISTDEYNAPGDNISITMNIEVDSVIKKFRKTISKQLNKKDCEKKIFIKKAKLSLDKESLEVNMRARITRQYCTRRAKTQVFEKTADVSYRYYFKTTQDIISLILENKKPEESSFEKSFRDVLESKPSKKIAEILTKVLIPDVSDIKQAFGITDTLTYRNVTIHPAQNKLTIQLTTSMDEKQNK